MIGTLTLAEELEVSGRDLLLPATYDLIWAAVCLAIIAYVLLVKALPAFTKVLDERSAKIEAGLAYAETAEEQAREAEEERRAIVDAARSDAATTRDSARTEASEIIAEARETAKTDAARILENGQRQLEAERQAAAVALRAEVGALATELASKIVGEALADEARQSRVVDRFLEDLEQQALGTTKEN